MSVVSYAEVQYAKAFLRLIGANADDTYLILAVTAWARAGGGFTGARGRNPFMVIATPDDAKIRIGTFRVDGITYSRYASTQDAFLATLRTLQGGFNRPILQAFRSQKGATGAARILDLISSLVWSPSHYLNKKGVNILRAIMAHFTGVQLDPPGGGTKPRKPPPKPLAQRTALAFPQPVSAKVWPRPLAPQEFLRARQWVPPIWNGGLGPDAGLMKR